MLVWLTGMLVLFVGVGLRIAGNKSLGADLLLGGALILILSRAVPRRRP